MVTPRAATFKWIAEGDEDRSGIPPISTRVSRMSHIILGMIATGLLAGAPLPESFLYQPAYCLDDCLRGPAEFYVPQPGDIFLATDESFFVRFGHTFVGGAGVHHSGFIFARPDGSLGLIEAGPFNELVIRVLDPYQHMSNHVACGTRVWVRRRRVPLTPDQSARLTAFASIQEGKRFALARGLNFATPFSRRGALRTPFVGRVHGDRPRFFCSELVVESFVTAGLMDRETARPSATLPRDLFLGHSRVPYLDHHLNMDEDWYPPARWLPGPAR